MRSLYEEYVSGSKDALRFFAAAPHALLEAPPTGTAWDAGLVDELRAYQSRLGSEATMRGDEAVIVTGQQPGLLVGPLYTVYKAATAIILARQIQERFDVPCVPVFWLAGDDHDFEEARATHILNKGHKPVKLRYEPEQDVAGLSMHRVPLEPSLHGLVDRTSAEASGFEFRDEVKAVLHQALSEAESLADWTARILARLFAGTPLVLFAPHLPAARRVAVDVIEREIAQPLASTRLLNEAGRQLEAAGFHAQVVKGEDECNFFLEVERRRCKVVYRDEQFRLPEKSLLYTQDELLELLHESPERFSPNVALRCIVQQRLFPAAAYVAGPGEIAYWAQLKPVFEHFGLKAPNGAAMPVVYPRARCVLTSIKLNKLLRKLGLSVGDLAEEHESLVERALRNANENKAYAVLQERRSDIAAAVQALQEQLLEVDTTAGAMAEKLGVGLEAQLDRMERTVLLQGDKKGEAVRAQVERLQSALMPWRKPQERVYTIVSFLFEHGWELVPRLLDELDVESFQLNEVEL